MINFKAWVEETRAGNFLVRHRDASGKKHNDYCIEKMQKLEIDGEVKTGRWLANALRDRVMQRYFNHELGQFDLTEKIKDCAESFLDECESNNRSICTIRHYDVSLRRFQEETSATTLADITVEKVRDWKVLMTKAGRKNATIRGRLSSLRCFLNWLVNEKKIGVSPFGKKMLPMAKEKEPQFYTRAEFKALDDALALESPMARLACNLAHDCGLRKIEIVGNGEGRDGVQCEDIEWLGDGKANLILRDEIVKGQKRGRVIRLTRGLLVMIGLRTSGPIVTIVPRLIWSKSSPFSSLFAPYRVSRTRNTCFLPR